MVRIELITNIAAPIDRCFDLSRSIDLHLDSTRWTKERAIAGVTSGLIGSGEEVTWKARFLGFPVTHTSRITAFHPPYYFQDSMVRGVFRSYCHDHYFASGGSGTSMKDVVVFSAPAGLLGRAGELLVVSRHLRKLLIRRNDTIRRAAEGDGWRRFLSS